LWKNKRFPLDAVLNEKAPTNGAFSFLALSTQTPKSSQNSLFVAGLA
jgi:hypothetical protein